MKTTTFLASLLLSVFCAAQWSDDYAENTLIADAQTSDIQSIGTDDGKTYVIFWDEVPNYILRVQLLDADGMPLFDAQGLEVNDVALNSTWTATRSQAVDTQGNLYVGFTATEDGNGFVNKISPTGEQLFGPSGINVGPGWNLKVLPTADGGFVAGWEEDGKGLLMRYDSAGTLLWDSNIEIDTPDAEYPFTSVGELALLSDGSFIVFFHIKTTSWNPNSLIWAQRYDAEGNPMWDNAVKISTQTTMSNRRYPVLQDGDVTYLGYYGAVLSRFDSYLQRIDPDGTLPWGINGSDFGTDDNFYEMTTSIAFDESSSYIWSAANICNINQSEYGQAIQKFDKETGETLLDEFGKVIFPISADSWIAVGDLQLVNNKPFFLFSNGISNGVNPIQLGVVFLDENGDFAWEDEYEFIATTETNKGRYDFTKNVDNQSVAVWAENRNGTSKAYAQNFVVEDEVMGTADSNAFAISLYPNPTKGIVYINSEKSISGIEIFGLNGQLLLQNKNAGSIDLNHLSKGVYVIKVTTADGKSTTTKIVKN